MQVTPLKQRFILHFGEMGSRIAECIGGQMAETVSSKFQRCT